MLLVLIVGGTVAAFWQGLGGEFLNWDDDRNFVHNESFQGLGGEQLRWAWSTYHLGVWQPLSWLVMSLQHCIGGLDPKVFHAASLIMHSVNAVAFFLLIASILRATAGSLASSSTVGIEIAAAFAALLFAVHPLRTEAVAWASCQPYLPAACFYMMAVAAYVHGYRRPGRSGPRWGNLLLAFTAYVLAVMFKAVAVSLPVMLIILDVYPLRRLGGTSGWLSKSAIRVWLEKLPFVVVSVFVSVWAAEAKDYSETRVPFAFAALDARLAQSAYGLRFYVYKTVAPASLLPYYELPKGLSLWSWPYGCCAVAVIVTTVGLISLRRRCPGVLAAWLAYVAILLPNLGLIQISQQLAADRYSYLAIMPLMLLLAGAILHLASFLRRAVKPLRITLIAAAAAGVLLLTAASRRQVLIWRDSVSLWEAALDGDPNCAVAECNLGVAFQQRGDLAEASRHLSRAIGLEPGFAFAIANFGTLLYQAGRYEDAAAALEKALELGTDLADADLAKVHATLGAAYAALRRDDLAWKHTRKAQELGFKDARKMIEYLGRFSAEPPKN